MEEFDYTQIAREFLRALRGRRSQVAWSRRLGYRSNVAYAWESGRRWPTAAETFRAIRRSGIDLDTGLERFYGRSPRWVGDCDPASPEGIAAILDDLRGAVSITDLSRRSGISRCSVSRWLSATTQPRLPHFFQLVQASSVRLIDLLVSFVDASQLPSILPLWNRMEARRRGAFERPWTQAITAALLLRAYGELPTHQTQWLAERLGLGRSEIESCIAFMEDTGQVRWTGTHYEPIRVSLDTRRDPDINAWLKAHWTDVARQRVQAGAPGQFSYNVFTVSRPDFERIRQLQLRYFRELRSIVAESAPDEVVAVANVQLFALETPVIKPDTPTR